MARRSGDRTDVASAGAVRDAEAFARTGRSIGPTVLPAAAGGAPSSNVIQRRNGDVEVLPPMFTASSAKATCSRHRIAGGGGWGDPRTRDEQDVASDVASLKLSREHALEAYGVCLDADGAVDAVATAAARAELRRLATDEPAAAITVTPAG